jgi:hypothetical protein
VGMEEVSSAPRSPWQNPFVERLIGSVRRECLDHIAVLGERHLCGRLASYFDYYHRSRTHLSLNKDAPTSRAVMSPDIGEVVGRPEVGGLHHRSSARPDARSRQASGRLPDPGRRAARLALTIPLGPQNLFSVAVAGQRDRAIAGPRQLYCSYRRVDAPRRTWTPRVSRMVSHTAAMRGTSRVAR